MSGSSANGKETTATIEQFVEQTGITFPVLSDTSESMGEFNWGKGISPYPRQILFDANGVIAYLATEHNDPALRAALDAL